MVGVEDDNYVPSFYTAACVIDHDVPKAKPGIKYKRPPLAPYQINAIFGAKRYGLIEASTKAGKTAGCLVWLLEQALQGRDGWNYWWVAPVYSQAKIAFRRMKRGIPRHMYKSNEAELTITLLPNGSVISFKSAEKPDNLYGEDVYAAVIDEASRCKAESWFAVRSTLTATRGPVRIIGNVKGRKNWSYKMCRTAELGDAQMSFARITALDAIAAGVISHEEVEDARRTLPANVFKELYMAEAADDEGRVYSAFQFAYNVSSDAVDSGADYMPRKSGQRSSVLIGMDFNVNPMCAVLAERKGDNLHVFGEVRIPNSNTERMAKHLRSLVGADRHAIVYPDASGSSRRTSAPLGQTDLTILRQHGFEVIAPAANPPVIDRVNETNAMFCSASGIRRLLINPSCTNLIEACDGLVWADSGGIDKSMGLDHITDALGYLVHCEFPINPNHLTSQRLGI